MFNSFLYSIAFFAIPFFVFIFFQKLIGIDKIFISENIYYFFYFTVPFLLTLLALYISNEHANNCLRNSVYIGVFIVFEMLLIINALFEYSIFMKLLKHSGFILFIIGYLLPFVYYYRSCYQKMNQLLTKGDKLLRGIWSSLLLIPLIMVVYQKYYGSIL